MSVVLAFDAAEAHAPVHGDPAVVLDAQEAVEGLREAHPPGAILIGIDRLGCMRAAAGPYDVLLTNARNPPAPWVGGTDVNAEARHLSQICAAHPFAASIFAQTLRTAEQLPFSDALAAESLAYSTLLGGRDFRAWVAKRAREAAAPSRDPRVRMTRVEDRVVVWLSRPDALNAVDARMRDELVEALSAVVEDPSARCLDLRGDGRAFCIGGDLAEFGLSQDLAEAHAIRTLRSPALLLHRLGARATAFVHGACVGAGVEMMAAATRVVADAASWFQLPEIGMGLMPGAGGAVSVPQRIGRHRALYWCLTGRRINAATAKAWGLVDEVRECVA